MALKRVTQNSLSPPIVGKLKAEMGKKGKGESYPKVLKAEMGRGYYNP